MRTAGARPWRHIACLAAASAWVVRYRIYHTSPTNFSNTTIPSLQMCSRRQACAVEQLPTRCRLLPSSRLLHPNQIRASSRTASLPKQQPGRIASLWPEVAPSYFAASPITMTNQQTVFLQLALCVAAPLESASSLCCRGRPSLRNRISAAR